VTKAELAREIVKIAKLTGQFKLRSGQTSEFYFDKYRFEAQPRLLAAIADQMKAMIPPGTEVLAGLEMGGIPVATALSLATGVPVAFIRKKAKDYGTCQFAEGVDLKGKKVCVIEDVVTTGGQVILSTQDLRSLGAQVEHVLCVIHRGSGQEPKLTEIGLKLHPLLTSKDLE